MLPFVLSLNLFQNSVFYEGGELLPFCTDTITKVYRLENLNYKKADHLGLIHKWA